jgi:hypothetical protein
MQREVAVKRSDEEVNLGRPIERKKIWPRRSRHARCVCYERSTSRKKSLSCEGGDPLE